MILQPKESMIAYRCPICGKNIMSMVGVFALSGNMIKLKCDCGGSELTINRTSDGKLRLSVPCIICPNPHNYVISENVFLQKDLFILSCSYSEMDICFIGKPDNVREALKNSDEELQKMLDDAGFENFDYFRSGMNTLDDERDPLDLVHDISSITEIVNFMLSELKADGAITCGCKDGDGDYGFEVIDDGVEIFCRKCGKYKEINLNGTINAEKFLQTDRLVLKEEDAVLPDFGDDEDKE